MSIFIFIFGNRASSFLHTPYWYLLITVRPLILKILALPHIFCHFRPRHQLSRSLFSKSPTYHPWVVHYHRIWREVLKNPWKIFLGIKNVLSLFRPDYMVSCLCRMTSSRVAPLETKRNFCVYLNRSCNFEGRTAYRFRVMRVNRLWNCQIDGFWAPGKNF